MKNETNNVRPRMQVHEYMALLREHQWSFESTSYYEFFKRAKRENELEAIAWANGPYFIKCYVQEQKSIIVSKAREAYNNGYNNAKSIYDSMIPTGDLEFDKFRFMVFNHDYYYEYSDDNNVWKTGEAQRKRILEIVKEKAGIYETFWNYYLKSKAR